MTQEEIKNKIIQLETLKDNYNNYQYSLKQLINSFYGIFGNQHFMFYNPDLAESITLQGRDINFNFCKNLIEKYFSRYWKDDIRLHEKLNIQVNSNVVSDLIFYGANDSIFLNGEPIIWTTNYQGDKVEFLLKLYKYKLFDLLDLSLQQYAKKYNTENLQKLKLEKVSQSGIFFMKNKYITTDAWVNDGNRYNKNEKITYKGVEIIQINTPLFVKKKLKEIIKFIFEHEKNINEDELIRLIKSWKDEFKLEKLENICLNDKINNYENFILNDRSEIKIKQKCLPPMKSAAIHNYLINQNPKYKVKYSLIKNKNRIKYYYTNDKIYDVFGFLPNSFPLEINPPEIDYDKMFNLTFINPLNKILQTCYNFTITNNLTFMNKLF